MKLYEEKTYLTGYDTKVIEVIEKDNKYHVVLEETIFYPEGGGQLNDEGTINKISVDYVYKEDEKVYHVLSEKVEGDVSLSIDFYRRFDFMQQHTGQHILSRAFEIEYDAKTVGSYIGEEKMTIDINKKLTEDEIYLVEGIANETIYKALNIKNHYVTKDELEKFNIRKKIDIDGTIRIVEIEDYDFCPCAGTHLKNTSEAGIIKILKVENYKEGHRVEFAVGKRAITILNNKIKMLDNIAKDMSVAESDILENVRRMRKEILDKNKEIKKMVSEYIENEANIAMNIEEEIIEKTYENMDMNLLRSIVDKIVKKTNKVVKCEIINKGIIYAKPKDNEYNIREEFNKRTEEIGAKGGGQDFFLQAVIK